MTATDSLDMKRDLHQVARNLRNRPARRLLGCGIGLLAGGMLTNIWLGETHPHINERWDGPAAIVGAIGGILIAASEVVRILQRCQREEIRQETSKIRQMLAKEMAGVEVERARRDMRLRDELRVGLAELRAEVAQCSANARVVRAARSRRKSRRQPDRPSGVAGDGVPTRKEGEVVAVPRPNVQEARSLAELTDMAEWWNLATEVERRRHEPPEPPPEPN